MNVRLARKLAQEVVDARITQRVTHFVSQPGVLQTSRFAHEREHHRLELRLRLFARNAGSARQAERIGNQVEIIAHAQVAVVRRMHHALRPRPPDREHENGGEIVGVDMVGVNIVGRRSAGVPFCSRASGRRLPA